MAAPQQQRTRVDDTVRTSTGDLARREGSPKRRKSWPIVLGVILALVAAVFVIGDHLARQYAERRVIDELKQVFSDTSVTRIDAELGGWPFLFTVVDKNLKTGHAEFDNLRGVIDGSPVHVVTGSVDFDDLHPINDIENATIGKLTAAATLDWVTLNAQVQGIRISHESGNRLQAVTSVPVFGVPIDIKVAGEVRLQDADGALQLIDPKAELAGIHVPDSIVQGVVAQVQDQLRLPKLPGIRYETIGVSAAGASVSVSGQNVQIAQLR